MPLVVYKASAGSGKTYTLTRDFILLALAGYENDAWKRILAVTFTNKAAAEMKERVIQKLSELSKGGDPELITWYARQTAMKEEEIQKKSAGILTRILHNYGSFSVLTIDSFLQRIFRSFLFELDVNYNYDLILDHETLIEETARAFIFGMQKNTGAFRELMKYLDYSIMKEEKFNIQADVVDIGRELTREELYRFLPELMDFLNTPEKAERVIGEILDTFSEYRRWVETRMKDCLELIKKYGLQEGDFDQKARGVYKDVIKICSDGFRFSISEYMKKSRKSGKYHHNDSSHSEVIIKHLAPVFDEIVDRYEKENARMSGLELVYRNLHVMNLMKYLEEKRRELLMENGFFFLGDIPRVLKSVIEQGGAGMVYEKSGNRFDHIFIDEFQDTSRLQWDNFAPLFENLLAQGLQCSVVGDVKQAIYRWRNGDWSILATGIKKAFPQYIREENLDTNRRSLPVIVDFNNRFFETATELLASAPAPAGLPEIADLYDGFFQKPWKKEEGNEGYVRAEAVYADNADGYRDYIASVLPGLITKLWEDGCRDIAILLRSNKSISQVLEALIASNPAYPVVTEKSFRLETYFVIRFITAMLKALAYFDDKTCTANACWSYFEAIGKFREPEKEFRFHDSITLEEFFNSRGYNADAFVIAGDTYTMTCAVAETFGISTHRDWQPFLSAFLDAVHQFQSSQPGTVQDFLKWYDVHRDDLQVQLENMSDAVKIMTIHKSKGLQFNTVILPYAGWPFRTGESNPLWFHSDDPLLREIPAVRIPCTQESGESIFSEEYRKEIYKSDVDNLNMLYVAMTRAEKQMYLFYSATRPKEENKPAKADAKKAAVKITGTSKLIHETLRNMQPEAEDTGTGMVFNFGKPSRAEIPVERENKHYRMNKGCYVASPELVISVDRKQEIFSESGSKIRHGVLLHYLLEKVKTKDDFEKALSESLHNKEIDLSSAELLKKTFDKLMTDSRFSEWFSGHYSVYNEHTLLSGNDMYRPDRIMVSKNTAIVADYKTGETEAEKYMPQLRKYMKTLRETGFGSVSGYIVRLDQAEIIEVT